MNSERKNETVFGKLSYPLYLLVIVWLGFELLAPWVMTRMKGSQFSRLSLQENLVFQPSSNDSLQSTEGARNEHYTQRHVVHPYLGFVNNPANRNDVNDWGFVGPNLPIEKNDSAFHIVITGGSVALQAYVHSQSLIDELQRSQSFAEKEIKVYCLAVGGYKQPQQLQALNFFLALGANFDLLINLDGFNEVALPYANNWEHTYPYFPRHWHRRSNTLPSPTQLEIWAEINALTEKKRQLQNRYVNTLTGQSYVLLLLAEAKSSNINRRLQDLNDRLTNEFRKAEGNYQSAGPTYTWRKETLFEDVTDHWANASKLMYAICQSRGIAYYHFLQPNQYVPGSKEMTEEENRKANILMDTDHPKHITRKQVVGVQEGYPLLRRKGRKIKESDGVSFHDLTMMFKNEKGSVYEDFCCHFDKFGVRLLNIEMAQTIVQDRLLTDKGK